MSTFGLPEVERLLRAAAEVTDVEARASNATVDAAVRSSRAAGHRRNSGRSLVLAGGAAALIVAISVGVAILIGHRGHSALPGAPPVPAITGPSIRSSAPSGQILVRSYTCGQAIEPPTDGGTPQAVVKVSIPGVKGAPNGAPVVMYRLVSTVALDVGVPPGRLRVLVLRNGRIVAGQDVTGDSTAHPPVGSKVLQTVRIDPTHPYTATLAAPVGMPCGGVSWSSLWNSDHQVAVVVSDRELTSPRKPGNVTGDDPVMVATRSMIG